MPRVQAGGLTNGSRLQEHPDGGSGSDRKNDPQDPVTANEEDKGQECENAGDQPRSSQHALASAAPPADTHGVISTSGFTDASQHDEVPASSKVSGSQDAPIAP
jgi:hypothetical protein